MAPAGDELILASAKGELDVGATCIGYTCLSTSSSSRLRLRPGLPSQVADRRLSSKGTGAECDIGSGWACCDGLQPTSPRGHLDELSCEEEHYHWTDLSPGELCVVQSEGGFDSPEEQSNSTRVRVFHVGGVAAIEVRELDTERAGLGHAVWPSALALTAYISEQPRQFGAGKRVLELGGGVCLPGLTASCLQPPPEKVTLSDLSDILVSNIHSNVDRNLESIKASVVEPAIINWDDFVGSSNVGERGSNGTPRQAMYDVIVGADVVYNPANAMTLSHAVLAQLRDGGIFYMTSPAPSTMRPGYKDLVRRLRASGTVIETALVLEHSHPREESGSTGEVPPSERCLRVFNFIIFHKNVLCLPAPSSCQM